MYFFFYFFIYLNGDKLKNKMLQELKKNKYKYIYLITIIIIGFLSGIILSNILSYNDQKEISNLINEYFINLKEDIPINYFHNLLNSLLINFSYVITFFILSMSIIGLILNPFILFIKSFIIGFSVGIMISIYSFNGILLGIFAVFPHQIINLFVYLIITFFSIKLSLNLFKLIFLKKQFNFSLILKKYLIVLGILSIILIISSLYEAFLSDFILKVFTFFLN